LTYLRDRLLLARELLSDSGSVFVQISDENLHHVREVMDEVFGAENFCCQIAFRKTTGKGGGLLDNTYDSLLWFAKAKDKVKFNALFEPRTVKDDDNLRFIEMSDGTRRRMTEEEVSGSVELPDGSRPFRPNPITSARPASGKDLKEFALNGKKFTPGTRTFSTDLAGMNRLEAANRLMAVGNTLTFVRYLDDFGFKPRNDIWDDTRQSGFGESKLYVVQTSPRAIERCMLMTTDPGDLVLDPTCGSGTSAVVAESWGRRWITIDTSRVPLALARQRLLTATFKYWSLKEPHRGPAGGFVYKEKRTKKANTLAASCRTSRWAPLPTTSRPSTRCWWTGPR
ncbi:MAG: site-specific DNA-methyltransferase, partial [Hydrogenophaga sp.]|nr:site-specific DNA-methyltransferase [Hydrogenophaga sp.]